MIPFFLLRRLDTGRVHVGSRHLPLLLRQCGFTLVELSVSMAIAAILAVASLEMLRQQLDKAGRLLVPFSAANDDVTPEFLCDR
jgi:prepilin-type N-terminal cleavage/methylation domain-containing protein